MDALPNQSDARFQAFLAKLLEQPQASWNEKQQIELDTARALSSEMLRIAEQMRADTASFDNWLALLKYAKVLDFILSSLAARREINPRTLRTILKLANFSIDPAYPE